MMPRQEGKREEKTEEAGHRRRKEVVVPRREGKREEKTEEAGHRRRKEAVMPRQKKSEKLQMQQKTGCQMARVLPGNAETVVLALVMNPESLMSY